MELNDKEIHFANNAKGFYAEEDSMLMKIRYWMQQGNKGSYDARMLFTQKELDWFIMQRKIARIGLMMSELGEMVESVRKGKTVAAAQRQLEAYNQTSVVPVELLDPDNPEHVQYYKNVYKDTVEDEAADAVIRVYDDSGRDGGNINAHIRMKLAANRTREYKHGKGC